MESKYWLAAITVAAFVLGTTIGPTLATQTIQALRPEQSDPGMQKFNQINEKINQKLEELSNQMNETKNEISETRNGNLVQAMQANESIAGLQKQIKVLDSKFTRISTLSDNMDELKKEIEGLKGGPVQSQSLSAVLDKSQYNPGDAITVSGVGLPNKPVKISLLDSDKLAINEGSTTSDSAGKFSFVLQLSKSLVTGSYTIHVDQEGQILDDGFRIVSVSTQVSGSTQQQTGSALLTVSADRSEYGIGDKVALSGKTSPGVWVDLDIFDANKVELVRTSTFSDPNGNYRYEYLIPSNAVLGTYNVTVTIGNSQANTTFSVSSSPVSSSPVSSPSSSSGNLTMVTDKSSYNRGDLVRITGKASASNFVTIRVEPPSGDSMILTPQPDSSGNYQTLMYIKTDGTTGSWKLTATQGRDTATTSIQVV